MPGGGAALVHASAELDKEYSANNKSADFIHGVNVVKHAC